MYIWVILATFIVALYSFNLSHRADMREVMTIPQAEAILGKMITQQNAAKKYIEDHRPPRSGDVVSYFPGELMPDGNLKKYLPYGFVNDRADGEFRTLIYCLNANDQHLATQATVSEGQLTSPCAEDNAITYVVTFGCTPRKWRNPKTNAPKTEFFKVLLGITISSVEVGYVEDLDNEEINHPNNVYKASMALRTKNIRLVPIPQFIASGKLTGADRSFSEVCGTQRQANSYSCDRCLTYMTQMRN